MQQIRHEDLRGGGKADLAALQLLNDADAIFIRDTTTEELIPVFGVRSYGENSPSEASKAFNASGTAESRKEVFIEFDTKDESILQRILEHVRILKGYQEYYGYRRAAMIGTLPEEQERDDFLKLFLAIQSNRGKHFAALADAALIQSAGLAFYHPATLDDAWREIDLNDVEAKTDALHKVRIGIMLMPPTLLDVRRNLPTDLAEALREMGRTFAVEFEAMATRVEQVPNDPFRPKPIGHVVRDSESGAVIGEFILYALAKTCRDNYELQPGHRAEIASVPVEESYALQRFMEGVKGKSLLDTFWENHNKPEE